MVIAAMFAPLSMMAKDNYDIYELLLDENLETPEIKNEKQADKVRDFQSRPTKYGISSMTWR